MKTNATKTVKTPEQNQKKHLAQVSRQVEMALASENVSDDTKECLKSIIIEASNEADLPLADFTLIRAALPNIIEKLGFDYGRGVIHSIHSIIQFNTDAFQKFYDERLDQDLEDLADLLSRVMKHPKMPTKLYNVMADELVENDVDADSPEWILGGLKKMECEK
jgi:hypothetical protein